MKEVTFTSQENLYAELNTFYANSSLPALVITGSSADELFDVFSGFFLTVPAAGGVVQDKQGNTLFIKRLGYWDLPKGKCEKNEDLMATALREVTEETGLKSLSIIRYLHPTYHTFRLEDRWVLKITHWYQMMNGKNELLVPQLKEGITEAVWISRDRLPQIVEQMYASLRDLF